MYTIHSAQVAVWICVEDPQAGFVPCTAKVNPQASVVREGVSDPVSAEAILYDDDNVAAIVEIPHRDAAPFARSMADCFNDKRVCSGIRRSRDTNQKSELSDLIRDTNDPFRKPHLIAPARVTCEYTGLRKLDVPDQGARDSVKYAPPIHHNRLARHEVAV